MNDHDTWQPESGIPPGWTDEEYAAYEAHCEEEYARHLAECGAPWEGGPAHDLYATHCDLPKDHEGDHSGPHPFGVDQPFTWTRALATRLMMRRYE